MANKLHLPLRQTALPLVGFVLLAAVMAFAPLSVSAHACVMKDSAGSVSGTVINGSRKNAAVPDFSVTLQAISLGKATDAATTKTDAAGHFAFSGLDTTGIITYAVYTHYQTGLFASDAILFTSGPAQQVTLKVYDTTSSNAALHIISTTLLFSNPDQPHGLIPVGELMTMENSGTTAYVASTAPANGLPMNLLRFWLPPNAQNLTLGAGFSDLQAVQVDTGFGVNATVPPGQSAYAFAYQLPYSDTQYTFQFKAEYPSDHIVALVPPGLKLTAGDFTAKSAITANRKQYQVLTHENAAANAQLSFGITNLPLPGEGPALDFVQLALVGLSVLLALLILLLLFLRRGALAVAFGWVPATMLTPGRTNQRIKSAREVERKRLLRSLLTLDERQSAGTIAARAYMHQRDQLRAQLRSLLALEQSTGKPKQSKAVAMSQSNTVDKAEKVVEVEAIPADSSNAKEQRVGSGERS